MARRKLVWDVDPNQTPPHEVIYSDGGAFVLSKLLISDFYITYVSQQPAVQSSSTSFQFVWRIL